MPRNAKDKASELASSSNLVINKLVAKLDKYIKGEQGDKEKDTGKGKGAGVAKQERASFKETQNTVVTGYAKPGSAAITGPWKFFDKVLDDLTPAPPKAGDGMPGKEPSWWKKLIGPALMILGGIAAFVMGLMTDGPLKGFLALLAKGGIMGGFAWIGRIIAKPMAAFVTGIKSFFGMNIVQKVLAPFKGIISKLAAPVINLFKVTIPNFFSKMLKPITGLMKGGGKLLPMLGKAIGFIASKIKFLPLIGALISWAFAISRFKGGDIIGGMIDLIAGFTSFLPPPIGIPLGIGLGILNAVLDAKSGGATGKQQKTKATILKDMALKVFGYVAKLPPFSTIYHLVKGVQAVVGGKWKLAANHFMFSIPIVGNLLEWFGVGFKGPDAEEKPGSKDSFWSSILGFLMKLPPFSTVSHLYQGIKAIIGGDFKLGATHMMYAIPGVGNLLEWILGPADAVAGEAKAGGSKTGFWSIISDYVLKMPPFSNIVHVWKGLKALFAGDWGGAGEHFLFAIPLVGNLLGFLAGGSDGGKGKKEKMPSVWQRIKAGVLSKFKWAWDKMPGFVKWMARKVLPDSVVKLLDNPDPETHDKIDMPMSGSAPEGGPTKVDVGGASSAVMKFLDKVPLVSMIKGFITGVKTVIGGDLTKGLLQMAYAIPMFGTLVSFLGGGATAEEAAGQIGDKKSFWGRIKSYILGGKPLSY